MYRTAEVAKMSGVSVRTLHHYDQIGLLVPERAANGYRAYTSADLARLQQILILRACGLELAQIAEALDSPGFDARTVLLDHLAQLERRRDALNALIDNVLLTVEHLEEGTEMDDRARFEGLKAETIAANELTYGEEARRLWGDETVDAANARLAALDEKGWNDMNALEAAIQEQLKAAMATGDPAGAEAAALVKMHARWISAHWPEGLYSPERHRALADGYLDDKRFTAYYDGACGEGATKFLRDAIHAWA